MKGYSEISLKGTEAPTYIKEESVKALRMVNAFVFDCDGVLLDTRESYNVCIKKTTEIIIKALTGQNLTVKNDYIFRLRDTGGFNNDWNIVYTLIQYYLSNLSDDEIKDLSKIYEEALKITVFERFNSISNQTKPDISGTVVQASFDNFIEKIDSTGISSMEAYLKKVNSEFSTLVKQVLAFPGDIHQSPITRLFEEFFLGSQLFEKACGVAPLYAESSVGLIEKDKIVITNGTLDAFTQFSKSKMGVASGSSKAAAEYILGDLLENFNQEAIVWMDYVDDEMSRTGRKGLHKPNPYSLNRAAGKLEPFDTLLYLGDTQADLSMVVQSERDDILFSGVTAYTGQIEKARKGFFDGGADIVTSSVNDIPAILDIIRGEMF